jgi:hypothetical protein
MGKPKDAVSSYSKNTADEKQRANKPGITGKDQQQQRKAAKLKPNDARSNECGINAAFAV